MHNKIKVLSTFCYASYVRNLEYVMLVGVGGTDDVHDLGRECYGLLTSNLKHALCIIEPVARAPELKRMERPKLNV